MHGGGDTCFTHSLLICQSHLKLYNITVNFKTGGKTKKHGAIAATGQITGIGTGQLARSAQWDQSIEEG